MTRILSRSVLPAALLVAACGGGGAGTNGSDGADNMEAAGEGLLPSEAEAADLANEAAADEAADMDLYGGNAAAGETVDGAVAGAAVPGNGA